MRIDKPQMMMGSNHEATSIGRAGLEAVEMNMLWILCKNIFSHLIFTQMTILMMIDKSG